MKRFLSSPFFLLAGLCFFLPFVTIACASAFGEGFTQELGQAFGEEAQIPGDLEQTFTGFDIVTGETESSATDTPLPTATGIPGLPAATPETSDNSQLFAIIALAAAGAGLLLSLLGGMIGPVMAIVFGLAGAAALFLVKTEIDGTIPAEAESFIDINYEAGYWVALGLFVVAAITGLVRMIMGGRRAYAAQPAPPPAAPVQVEPPTPEAPPP